MKHLLTIILLSVGLQVSAQVTPTLPSGATSYSSQIYRKISGSDTTYYTGASGKWFLKLAGFAEVLRLQDSIETNRLWTRVPGSPGYITPRYASDRLIYNMADTLTTNDGSNYSHFYEVGGIKMSSTDRFFGRIGNYGGYSNTVPVVGGQMWGGITYAIVGGTNTQDWSEDIAQPLHPNLLGQATVVVSAAGATGTIESASNFVAFSNWQGNGNLDRRFGYVVSNIRNTGAGIIGEQVGFYGEPLTAATNNFFMKSEGGRNRLAGTMELPNLSNGSGGVDSTVVHDNTTDELRKVGNTGTGSAVYSNSPTLVTPVLGAATGTSLVTSGKIATTGAGISIGSDGSGFQGRISYDASTGLQTQGKTGSSYDWSLYTPTGDEVLTNATGTQTLKAWGKLTVPTFQITSGASNGYVLKSDASGNASWQAMPSSYKGTWNASTNTPTVADGVGTTGDYYEVSTSGTQFGRSFTAGGRAIYNGTIWEPVGVSASVTSVNGYTGAVTLAKSDLSLGSVDNTSDATKNSATATLTNKTISGASNTITNIAQSSVTNLTSDLSALMPKAGGTFTGGVTGTSWTSANSIPFVLSSPTTIDFHQSGAGTVRFVNDTFTGVNLALTNAGDMTVRNNLTVVGGTVTASTFTGNSATATALVTPRTIAGVSFDGSANISLNNNLITNGAGYITGNQSITLSGAITGSGTTAITTTLASGIDATKLADGTVTSTELQYINSLTSNAQNQLNTKAPLASPTFTGTVSGITKSMVGLSSVDNTSDASKPVSTATQTALDLKAPLASPALTGTPTAPTATAGDNSTKIATTAYVDKFNLASGVYTPTITSVSNVASVSGTNAHYKRVGNEVFVQGRSSISTTLADGSDATFTITLPTASAMTASSDATGSTIVFHGLATNGEIIGEPIGDTVQCTISSSTTASISISFSFTYTVK